MRTIIISLDKNKKASLATFDRGGFFLSVIAASVQLSSDLARMEFLVVYLCNVRQRITNVMRQRCAIPQHITYLFGNFQLLFICKNRIVVTQYFLYLVGNLACLTSKTQCWINDRLWINSCLQSQLLIIIQCHFLHFHFFYIV
nr:MAG TPA: hypothetical protein [Caudoviricetes sp.]